MCKLITADWHLDDSISSEYRWNIFNLIKSLWEDYKFTSLYVLGDLTDKKNNHDAKFVHKLISKFEELVGFFGNEFEEIIILEGNHDYTDENSPFFSILDRIDSVYYIKDEFFDTATKSQWLPNKKNFNYSLNKEAKYIFMHQPIKNSDIGGNFLKSGLDIEIFREIKDNIIYAGDIHSPQKVGNVTYVGSPYHIKFGDSYEGRVLLLSDDGLTKEIVTSNCFPSKLKIEITSSDLEKIDSFFTAKTSIPLKQGDFIKVVVAINQEEKYRWDEFRNIVKELSKKDNLILSSIEASILKTNEIKLMNNKKNILSDQDVLNEFVKKEGLNNFYLEIGMEVLKEEK